MTAYDQTIEQIIEQPTMVYGLKFFPSLEPFANNNADGCMFEWPHASPEVSDDNVNLITEVLKSLSDKCKVIVEIGVHRNDDNSITRTLMDKRPKHNIYLGIDINDKSYLNNQIEGIYTIKCSSHDQNLVRQKLMKIGAHKIDLLSIDGWHSVNSCINDWMYADMLSEDGVVIMHDSNAHPGPIALFHAIDEKIFFKQRYCTDMSDNGIAVAWHRPS